jgi:uncharacterized protein YceK
MNQIKANSRLGVIMNTKQISLRIILSGCTIVLLGLSGCSTVRRQGAPMGDVSSAFADISIDQNLSSSQPGVVEYVWEEPMVDVIEVPPGLDAEGIYYRPAHNEVVEIRQGRWQYYKQQRR